MLDMMHPALRKQTTQMIDYNQKVNRIGIGLSVTDWLD